MAKKKVKIKAKKGKGKAKAKQAKKKEFFGLMDLPEELADRGREIWLAGLGALSMVEEEGSKLFSNLVEKGEQWEEESREKLGTARKKLDEAQGKATAVAKGAAEEVAQQGGKLRELDDRVFAAVEHAVEGAVQRLGVPTRAEVKDLTAKVEQLSTQVASLASTMQTPEDEAVVYHVVPREDGWAVAKEGAERATSTHATKKEAVEAGRTLATAKAPSRLVVHKQDGTIQDTFTYEG